MAAASTIACACGGSAPPPPAPPPLASAAPVVAAQPDLSEVPEPAHLIGVLRWKNPEATLKTVYEWTGIKLNPSDLAAEAFDKALAGSLAFDAPVDAAVSLDDKGGAGDLMPFFAVAVGVHSLEAAREAARALGTVTELGPGEYKVTLRHGKRKGDRPHCVLSAAIGPAPARFVCGRRERDVEALRPYLARTLPKRDLGAADLHIEFHIAPAIEIYGPMINQGLHIGAALAPRKLEIGEPAFDRALERATAALAEELGATLADADAMTFDLAMTPDRATASGTLRLRGRRSWTASVLANQAARAAPAPTIFWRLPAGATSASFYFPPEIRRFDGIRRAMAELLDGWLVHEGLAPADRAEVDALLGDKFTFDAPWVSASGPFATRQLPAPAKNTAGSSSDLSKENALRDAIDRSGWRLFGFGAPNQISDFLKSVSSTLARPKVQAFVKSKLSALSSQEGGSDENKWISAVAMKAAPAPKELPKGSLAFDILLSLQGAAGEATAKPTAAKKTKAPPLPLKLYLLVVSEPAQTWVAVGSDRAQLVKPLLAALEGAPESGTLAANREIASLRDDTLSAASFTTIESMLEAWSGPAAWLDAGSSRSGAYAMLASTPHQGKTPIVMRSEVSASGALTWGVRADIPKGVVEDAIILGASAGLSGLVRP